MSNVLIAELSAELLLAVARLLDTDALLALEQVSRGLRLLLHDAADTRCRRECLGRFLQATIATQRMLAPVPPTWRQLYRAFASLRGLRWHASERDGAATAASLRALRSDNHEYAVDGDARFLLKSGGHYWFSVWQSRAADIALAPNNPEPAADAIASFLRAPRAIRVGRWEKIRAGGQGPSPRRHHSMTCLADARCPERALHLDGAEEVAADGSAGREVAVRRLLVFGGQSEGIPFDASNELFLLGVQQHPNDGDRKLLARWMPTAVAGQPPSRRCGHAATLLAPDLLVLSGGSDGTTPIQSLEVHLLHVEGVAGEVSSSELLVFGGRQIRQSNALLSVHRLRVQRSSSDAADIQAEWSSPELTGDVPHPRRGHSTTVIGDQLLLFGGQSLVTGALENDLRVLDVRGLRWATRDVPGAAGPPCPRRGFKTQYFGTSLVISGGFVASPTTGRIDKQLADSDVHVLVIA
ncbi:hypothetical protein PybrP1_007356 [[Pythium] brassicae (nom. inval.)]|nr:hypothetical protein PybrP1_007356 [[Pythium] brassicae (nom. inval.)]